MLDEQSFDAFFNGFVNSAGGAASGIKEVYSIMPYMTDRQIKIYADAKHFATKWATPEIMEYLDQIVKHKQNNRSLGFMPSVKNFMKYSTLDEKVRNVKIQQTNNGDV